MSYKHYALLSALVVAFLPGMVGKAIGSAEPNMMEQTLTAIQDCVADSSIPWPDAWQREYVDTIRKAIASHQDSPEYKLKLEILYNGFQSYWQGFKKSQDRSLFDVHLAQIRWYTEHLMCTKLPCEEEKQKLRNQYEDLYNHAASSLLTQFPFLDPNAVHAAKAEHLSQRYRNIDAPLLPAYLCPFSEAQVGQIKQRWHDLRYARVDLWRQLGGDATASTEDRDAPSFDAHPHYLLAKRSLAQLQSHIWAIVAPAPDYFRSALRNMSDALRDRLQSRSQARRQERRLEKEHSRQLLQIEHISFLLAALLETPRCFDEPISIRTQENALIKAAGQNHERR